MVLNVSVTLDECTLAILMRSDVHPGDLPKETGRSTIKSDTSSYKEIASAAFAVYDYCAIRKPRVPGWAQVGRFLLAHSILDELFPSCG